MNGPKPSHCAPEGCQQPLICPLSRVPVGADVRIKQLDTPPEITHRLREMGFCEEQRIRLLSSHTSVICEVCNARLGLSAQLAENILVEAPPHQQQRAG